MARVRFRGAKHSPKKLEKEILDRSKALWEDPEILRPRCIGSCRRCHFDKPLRKMHDLDRIKDNPDRLVAAASRGDNMVRGYAATASLYAAGKIPYMATARFPGEEVSFAVRGKVGQDKLIGTQYYDDPEKRPLFYMEIAKKRKLWLYSLEDEILCSDRANMPDAYLEEILADLPYDLDSDWSCGHDEREALVIHIISSDRKLRVCRDCAGRENTLQALLSRMVSPRPMDDIRVLVDHHFCCDSGEVEVDAENLDKYQKGMINDQELIDVMMRAGRRELKDAGMAVYVACGRNHGDDLDALLAALRGSDDEKQALRAVLGKGDIALAIEGDRTSEALQELWADHAEELILAVSSPEVRDELGDFQRLTPAAALQEAALRERSREILADIPKYEQLGEIGSLADRLARLAKTGDPSTLRREIESRSLRDYKARAVALAFIKATSEDAPDWQFSREEIDFATYLQQFATMMVEANGKEYHDALETMLTASGSSERVDQ